MSAYRFFTVIKNRRMLAEFDTEIEAEEFAAGIEGSLVTVMTVPSRY